ncbi:MAG: hypothetical protein IJ678_07770 [Kiritimatiellae bacterium]|nr:hypothetical protein [Kiritimatiellia bacterium]
MNADPGHSLPAAATERDLAAATGRESGASLIIAIVAVATFVSLALGAGAIARARLRIADAAELRAELGLKAESALAEAVERLSADTNGVDHLGEKWAVKSLKAAEDIAAGKNGTFVEITDEASRLCFPDCGRPGLAALLAIAGGLPPADAAGVAEAVFAGFETMPEISGASCLASDVGCTCQICASRQAERDGRQATGDSRQPGSDGRQATADSRQPGSSLATVAGDVSGLTSSSGSGPAGGGCPCHAAPVAAEMLHATLPPDAPGAEALAAAMPFLTVHSGGTLNPNTTTREAFEAASVAAGASPAVAEALWNRIAALRERGGYFASDSPAEARRLVRGSGGEPTASELAVLAALQPRLKTESAVFRITAVARSGNTEVARTCIWDRGKKLVLHWRER